MKLFSQNKEDLFVLNYFKDFKGTLLEIGANDGETLSNSLLLIQNGWQATLLEPGSTFKDLEQRHLLNDKVQCLNIGIGEKDEAVLFWESGTHTPQYGNCSDRGLVSSVNYEETERWRKSGVQFDEKEISLLTFKTFMNMLSLHRSFDFISIDVEGLDWQVLQQIDLSLTFCLCIEWNGIEALKVQFENYCNLYGLKLAHINNENLIFTK